MAGEAELGEGESMQAVGVGATDKTVDLTAEEPVTAEEVEAMVTTIEEDMPAATATASTQTSTPKLIVAREKKLRRF